MPVPGRKNNCPLLMKGFNVISWLFFSRDGSHWLLRISLCHSTIRQAAAVAITRPALVRGSLSCCQHMASLLPLWLFHSWDYFASTEAAKGGGELALRHWMNLPVRWVSQCPLKWYSQVGTDRETSSTYIPTLMGHMTHSANTQRFIISIDLPSWL